MDFRDFGTTGLKVSALGFGCGSVGGLMVRGDPVDQARVFARAIDAGVSYFDTASQYGNGASEETIGRLYREVRPSNFVIGTKVRIKSSQKTNIQQAIFESIDASLKRLQMERVDVLHLHNAITATGEGDSLLGTQVISDVLPAFQSLQSAGKIGYFGITATGDTPELSNVIQTTNFKSAQLTYNLLNPSAVQSLPPSFPAQDFDRLLDKISNSGVAAIGIRVLAGGALTNSSARHINASDPPKPIASSFTFASDFDRAQRFNALLAERHAESLPELAFRYAISQPAISTALVGIASMEEFNAALGAALKGPLAPETLMLIAKIQSGMTGLTR